MQKADDEALTKLPEPWRNQNAAWLTVKLRDEVETLISADKEFAVFMEAEKQRTQRTFQQAKIVKVVATVLAIAILLLVLIVGYLFLKKSPQFHRRGETRPLGIAVG